MSFLEKLQRILVPFIGKDLFSIFVEYISLPDEEKLSRSLQRSWCMFVDPEASDAFALDTYFLKFCLCFVDCQLRITGICEICSRTFYHDYFFFIESFSKFILRALAPSFSTASSGCSHVNVMFGGRWLMAQQHHLRTFVLSKLKTKSGLTIRQEIENIED
jgi:hypothetical protein